jgi:hypothetical protein
MEYSYEALTAWKEMDDLEELRCVVTDDLFNYYKSKHGLQFYFPNYDAAPWQVQCKIGEKVINFWPHKAKAHIESTPGPAIEGTLFVRFMVNKVLASEFSDDFDVVVIDY